MLPVVGLALGFTFFLAGDGAWVDNGGITGALGSYISRGSCSLPDHN